MTATLLNRLLTVCVQCAGAERGLAFDAQMNVVGAVNVSPEFVQTPDFVGVSVLQQALAGGQPVITNNMVADATAAPTTNTNFAGLRAVVVLPVGDLGTVYFDQPIRRGLTPRTVVERLQRLADYAFQVHPQATEAELTAQFAAL